MGREEELVTPRAEGQRVVAGEPRLLLISGEAGIGKTSLADELLLGQPEFTVLRSSGDESDTDMPYGRLRGLDTAPTREHSCQRSGRTHSWRAVMAKKARCYLNRHRWVMQTAEGQPYAVCRDCNDKDWDHYQRWQGSRPSGGQAGTPSGYGLGTGGGMPGGGGGG